MTVCLRTSTLHVSRFLAALAAAGLHERAVHRGIVDEDFDHAWMRLAIWPPVRRRNPGDALSVKDVLGAAERQFGFSRAELMGKRRTAGLCRARFAAWRACRYELGMSLPDIGRRFGKDHSTIHHGLKRAEALGLTLELGA